MEEFLIGDSVEVFVDSNDYRYTGQVRGFIRAKRNLDIVGNGISYKILHKSHWSTEITMITQVNVGFGFYNRILTSRMVLIEKKRKHQ